MEAFKNKLKVVTGFFIMAMTVVSCLPEDEFMGDAGQTLVKLYPQNYNKVLFAPVATPQTAAVLEVRRDLGGEASLNSTTTVVLKFDQDTAMINEYNYKNDDYFSLLPSSLYTSDPAVAADTTVTVVIGPGEFVKSVMITVPNVFDFDFSNKYALAYKLISVSGTGTRSVAVSDTCVIEIAAQNAYEGWYHSVGFRDHPTAGVFPVDDDKYLYTVDQYTVETYTGDYIYYRLWITVDPNAPLENNVTIMSPDVVLFNNDPTVNIRDIQGGYNRYDPEEKAYFLYYYYNSSAPRVIEEVITRK
jgi:hypothetical protein